jgi:hypothetical protein
MNILYLFRKKINLLPLIIRKTMINYILIYIAVETYLKETLYSRV